MFARRFLTQPSVTTFTRSLSHTATLNTPKFRTVTLINGDGIGPEICASVVGVFQAARVPVKWETFNDIEVTADLLASLSRNQVCLKGPWYTDIKEGPRSRGQILRTSLELYANVVRVKSLQGVKTRHDDIDMVIVRENTQGEYTGIEETVVPGVVQSIKIITRDASTNIAHYAFNYAQRHGRKRVTAIHKANIMKLSDGCFINAAKEVSKLYPDIQYQEMIIDNACMQLAMNPYQFDVLLLPNLYGTLVTNLGAGLIGGTGVIGGVNIGRRGEAIFEPGRHTAKDIAGKNLANPTGIILASVAMLRHMNLSSYADRIERALLTALKDPKCHTRDLGGNSSTKAFTKAVIDLL